MDTACRIIIDDIISGKITTRRELEVEKRQLCRDRNLKKFMSNSQILAHASLEEKKLVSNILKKKPTRTISGVAIVAVMCHPHKCPHGRCLYCPESSTAPPSYTGEEPAALRGRMFEFHPYVQCFNRLKQLHKVGHNIDKVELIIMGGTFPSRDLSYQEWFVSQCLKAMTDSLGAKYFVRDFVRTSATGVQVLLPVIVFLVGCLLAFATGTSWGTFGILIPIVQNVFSMDNPMAIVCISACMAGAVCGDHCSPISDTTIMASAGAQCDHVNHVSTQLPYAITCAVVSGITYLVSGILVQAGASGILALPIGVVLMLAALFIMKKSGRKTA